MIKFSTNDILSRVHDKSDIVIANELVTRVDTLNRDRSIRLNSVLFKYNDVDVTDTEKDYFRLYEVRTDLNNILDESFNSISNYFDSLSNISKFVRQISKS